jgi:hypothetical protein
MNTQPNFEKLKTAFYRTFISNSVTNSAVEFSIIREHIASFALKSFHKRYEEFENDFNQWLDRLDIRCAGQLIDVLKTQKNAESIPQWMKNKHYAIDYNKHEQLDLIPLD